MLTILHTESSTGWGGQENRTLQEAIQMKARGHRVLIAAPAGARLLERAREEAIETFPVTFARGLKLGAIFPLRQLMKREKVDILNTHSSRDTIVAGLAARSLWQGPLIVRTRHLIMPITSTSTYTGIPDHVVAVSDAVREYLISAGVPPARVTTVHTGINPERFQPAAVPGDLKQELGLTPDTPLIGSVSILRVRKGHRHLLEAIPDILKEIPNAHFVLAGDGPQEQNLKTLVQNLGLVERVHFLGLRRDVPNILKSLDVFVLPTYDEALGTAFLEAQAMETPVIGTLTGGVPEAIRDGKSGFLVPVQDPASLGQAIINTVRSLVVAEQMGKAGRAFVLSRFTVDRMADEMLSTYEKLLSNRVR